MKVALLLCFLLSASASLKEAFQNTSKERFLVLSFPNAISMPQKMLTVASASILSIISNRSLIINDDVPGLLFFDPLLSMDDVQLDPQTMNNTLAEPLEALKYFGCNLDGPLNEEYTLYLTSGEYFLPPLFLNPKAKDFMDEMLPKEASFKYIVDNLFSFPEQLELAVKKRYEQAMEFFGGDIVGTVIDSNASSNFFLDSRLAHKCIIPKFGSNSIIHVISTLPQYNRMLQEHYPKLIFTPSADSEFQLLVELLFQARYASDLVLYPNSALSQVVQALANKPAVYLRNAQSTECFMIEKPEPCYAHSLKQFYQVCAEKLGIEFNPHDLITYPNNIDSCKDAKIGIKVIKPIDQ